MSYTQALEKAAILSEALPYIQKFHGKIVVVKYGGNAMINEELKRSVINDLILMHLVGMRPIIVHGGGPEINITLQKMGINTHFVNGQRYTDEAIMNVVQMVLIGKINTEIVSHINHNGGHASGISGVDGNFLRCVQQDPSLGFVGKVKEVNVDFMLSILNDGLMPVVSPIGFDESGQRYNINADYAAGKIAEAMKAEKLLLLTDVEGIYANPKEKKDIISVLRTSDVPALIEKGVIDGGMIPKVNCCVSALAGGVKSTHILDGRKQHSILLEIFTKEGIGTMVTE
ncbi:MAG: acetylglutamate kinase [Bacillota bacterium]|jgi:acetylglutamate kinase